MMSNTSGTLTNTGFTDEAFAAFLESRREPEWVSDYRREAWQAFCELGFPDSRHEEWKRTELRTFRLERFGPPSPPAENAPVPQPLLTEGVNLAGRTVALDSSTVRSELDADWRERGVLFGDLETLVAKHGELLRPHLARRIVDPRRDKFAALHGAFWSGGTLLYVPRGVVIDRPLHVFSALSPGGVNLGHCLVVLEEDSEATLLAETASSDPTASGLHCGAIEILVGPAARLRYVNLQNWAQASGTSPISRPWSSAMRGSNGPSAPWAPGWPRSTSTWPSPVPMPRSRSTA